MYKYLPFFFILLIEACAPERYVKPLAAKQQATGLALGVVRLLNLGRIPFQCLSSRPTMDKVSIVRLPSLAR